jgi:hypothetical protein
MHTRTCVLLITSIVALFFSQFAAAEKVKSTQAACVSEELLDEVLTYAAKNDNEGIKQLLISGSCTLLKVGEDVSVISPGFLTATIRYRGVKLFTPSEAVR